MLYQLSYWTSGSKGTSNRGFTATPPSILRAPHLSLLAHDKQRLSPAIFTSLYFARRHRNTNNYPFCTFLRELLHLFQVIDTSKVYSEIARLP